MKFKDYVEKYEPNVSQLAKDIGVSRTMLYDYLHNGATPSLEKAYRIKKLTGDRVTFTDWHKKSWDKNIVLGPTAYTKKKGGETDAINQLI